MEGQAFAIFSATVLSLRSSALPYSDQVVSNLLQSSAPLPAR